MSQKLRSVNTKFWSDPVMEKLDPAEKLLFLYLLTNPHTNMLGIYEVSIARMAGDTGLTEERVRKSLEAFETLRKAFYMETYVVLPNFLKNQKMNTNMQKGAIALYKDLPNWLMDRLSRNPLEAFESLSKALESFEKEKGKEKGEEEKEIEDENILESARRIYQAYPSKCPIKGRTTGKSSKDKGKIITVLKSSNEKDILEIIDLYIKDCVKTDTMIKNFSTFLNNLPDKDELTAAPSVRKPPLLSDANKNIRL